MVLWRLANALLRVRHHAFKTPMDISRKLALCLAPLAGRGFSRRFRRFQSEPRLDRLAHQEFLDLAGDGHRKFVDEFDVARDFIVRDLALAEAADLLGRERFARSRADPCA